MTKQILLSLVIAISCNILYAQVEHNTTGILGLGYKVDAAGPMVESVTPGSPAYVAGVQKNDRLLKINDQSLAGITLEALTEKFKIPMGVNIKIVVEHEDKTQQEVVLKKAAFFSASYKIFRYMIFFDENNIPVCNPYKHCVWGDDCYNGFGYYVYSSPEAFCGEFENGNRKEGLYYYVKNDKPYYYLGEFLNDEQTGKGTLTFPSDKNEPMIYTGDFLNANMEGTGSIKNLNNGNIFTGSFKAGKKEGYGKETTADGTILIEGQWKNGVFQDPKNENLKSTTETQSASDFPVGTKVRVSDFRELLNSGCSQFFAEGRTETQAGVVIEADLIKNLNGKYSGCIQEGSYTKHGFQGAKVEKITN